MELGALTYAMLDAGVCDGVLRRNARGRIALSVNALPVILPVAYEFLGEEIVMQVDLEDRNSAALDHAVVAFEVDEFDPVTGEGLSVMVRGFVEGVESRGDAADQAAGDSVSTRALPMVSLTISMLDGRAWSPLQHR